METSTSHTTSTITTTKSGLCDWDCVKNAIELIKRKKKKNAEKVEKKAEVGV